MDDTVEDTIIIKAQNCEGACYLGNVKLHFHLAGTEGAYGVEAEKRLKRQRWGLIQEESCL